MSYVSLVNISLTREIQLSYLPYIKYCGLPVSVSCPVYRNVNDEECLPLVSVSKGCTGVALTRKNCVFYAKKEQATQI